MSCTNSSSESNTSRALSSELSSAAGAGCTWAGCTGAGCAGTGCAGTGCAGTGCTGWGMGCTGCTTACLVMGTLSTIFTISSESGPLAFSSVNRAVLTAWLLNAVLIFLLIKASLKVWSKLRYLLDIF